MAGGIRWGAPLAYAQAENQQSPQSAPPTPNPATSAPATPVRSRFLVTVVDEDGVALSGARVRLTDPVTHRLLQAQTDFTGACSFLNLPAGHYQLHVDKVDFYAYDIPDFQVVPNHSLEVALHHVQEYHEQITVQDSPPAIDPQRTVQSQEITSREIFSLPYPTTRDYRNVLPFLPGVIQDPSGQVHLGGSASYQIFDTLDGFNMTQPATGLLDMRVSTDAIRRINVETSRYSTEYGKASGGVLQLESMMGDDHYRFTATNFLPGLDFRNGVNFQNWNFTPRVNFSGPIRKGKAWFFEGVDGEYDKSTVLELPPGQNATTAWRMSSLSRVQVNLSPSHILTGSFLINEAGADEVGLSLFNPLPTTFRQPQSAYLGSLKDSIYLPHGILLELGVGVNGFRTQEIPQGTLPYVLTPETAEGNFYRQSLSDSRRVQGISNVFLPPIHWHGRHDFKFGTDIDALRFDQQVTRRPISVLRQDGTLDRQITFSGPPQFFINNYELSVFAQDRWAMTDKLLVEAGVRSDRDHIVSQWVTSPRIAGTYMLAPHTKIVAGVGLYYDATNLALVSRPEAGERFDQFYQEVAPPSPAQPNGVVVPMGPPIPTEFLPNLQPLKAPRFVNWSIGIDHKLPANIYANAEYLQKRGRDEFTYVNESPDPTIGMYRLTNAQRDQFYSLRFTARKQYKENYEVLASYTRSSARSNAVIDFNLDNPVFATQSGGPLAWDAPNRFISWGWAPLGWVPHMKKFDLAWSAEYHTGFPFSVVDQFQRLVGVPDSNRFPSFFTLNLHIERRFHLHGYEWALRGGFNNLTGRSNPTVVNNNIDSPTFLTFAGTEHRSFTARIRLLGRSK